MARSEPVRSAHRSLRGLLTARLARSGSEGLVSARLVHSRGFRRGSLDRTDSSHSALAARTGLHAPKLPFDSADEDQREHGCADKPFDRRLYGIRVLGLPSVVGQPDIEKHQPFVVEELITIPMGYNREAQMLWPYRLPIAAEPTPFNLPRARIVLHGLTTPQSDRRTVRVESHSIGTAGRTLAIKQRLSGQKWTQRGLIEMSSLRRLDRCQ